MHYSQTAAAVAALSVLASASPVTPSLTKLRSAFSVQQSSTGKMIPRSGPAAYRKALAKYGAPVPSYVQVAAAAQQSGSVTANPTQYDAQYLSPVSVGGQTLMLDFDTGSADLWCFSTELPSSETNGQTEYDPSKSGKKIQGASWKISYGDGSGASGDVYADTVAIGGVTATGQAVEAATQVSSQFSQDKENDGLVGFAFSSINTVQPQQQKTWFDTVVGSLPQPLFAVTLKYQQAGSYDFGYIDNSKYTGDISYADVDDSNGFWEFTADGYSVGDKSSSASIDAIADTGTSLILISDDIVQAYYSAVQGAQNSQQAGGYVFSCSASLPDFSITIGGGSFLVPGKYINFAPNGDGTCYGGIQSSQGIGFNILGDVFLKNQYVIFDEGNKRLGFAAQSGGVSNSSSNARAGMHLPTWASKPRDILSHTS